MRERERGSIGGEQSERRLDFIVLSVGESCQVSLIEDYAQK